MEQLNDTELLDLILQASFNIKFNMNDTFYWGCSDSCEMPPEDLRHLLPLIKKYSYSAVIAYEAVLRGHNPEKAVKSTGPNFFAAKKEILKTINSTTFPKLFGILQLRKEEIDLFGEEIQYQQDFSKNPRIGKDLNILSCMAYLPNAEIGVVASNKYLAKKKLIAAFKALKEV